MSVITWNGTGDAPAGSLRPRGYGAVSLQRIADGGDVVDAVMAVTFVPQLRDDERYFVSQYAQHDEIVLHADVWETVTRDDVIVGVVYRLEFAVPEGIEITLFFPDDDADAQEFLTLVRLGGGFLVSFDDPDAEDFDGTGIGDAGFGVELTTTPPERHA